MTNSLKDYRERLLDGMLGFLWRQWQALGMPGYGSPVAGRMVDPEAILALTCTLGRYEARLFDEMLDWLVRHERFINVQRLRTIMIAESYAGKDVLAGAARFLARHTHQKRWERLAVQVPSSSAGPSPLFFSKTGRALPVLGEPDPDFQSASLLRGPVGLRHHASFRTEGVGAVVLRLRALMGVSARCEILLFLLTHPSGHGRHIAAETGYAQKTIHDALEDMALSGYVDTFKGRRERLCRITSKELVHALLGDGAPPEWVNWPRVLGALERAWIAIDGLAGQEMDPQLALSQIRMISESLIARLHSVRSFPALPKAEMGDLEACMRPIMHCLLLLEEEPSKK